MTTATTTATPARRTATINLPLVTAQFRAPQLSRIRAAHVPRPRVSMPHLPQPRVSMPHLPHPSMPQLPSRREVIDLGHGMSGFLPPRDQLVLYGGLGAAATLGLLDWPVALAVGAGTAVARRRNGGRVQFVLAPPAGTAAPGSTPAGAPRKAPAAKKTTTRKRTPAKRAASTSTAKQSAATTAKKSAAAKSV